MKISYEFVNEKIEIEVSDDWEKIILELDRKEESLNKKETRRHCTLSVKGDEGAWLASTIDEPCKMLTETIKISEQIIVEETLKSTVEKLTPKQKILVEEVFYKGMSLKQLADIEGVSRSAITQRYKATIKKLKKFSKTT